MLLNWVSQTLNNLITAGLSQQSNRSQGANSQLENRRQVMIGFNLSSDWLREWCKFFFDQSQCVKKQNYCNSKSPLTLSWKMLYYQVEFAVKYLDSADNSAILASSSCLLFMKILKPKIQPFDICLLRSNKKFSILVASRFLAN